MAAPRFHVVGAGLAGLAAAVELGRAGVRVSLYEAAPHAGGRCRSYLDKELGCRIDNGNHLLLAGNDNAMAYVEAIGARGDLIGPPGPEFPFFDLATGERWTLRPDRLTWPLDAGRRLPGTRAADYLGALKLAFAGAGAAVGHRLSRPESVFRRLWRPFAVAALNTQVEEASARLLWRTLRLTFGRGAAACRPLVPRVGLSESLIDPALAILGRRGIEPRYGERLRRLGFSDDGVRELEFPGQTVRLGEKDRAILALPAGAAAELVPGLVAPDDFRAIVNAHYRVRMPEAPLVLGLVGGVAEWVFHKEEVVSVTVSAAERYVDLPAEELADRIWADVARAYGVDAPQPPARIVKERRATFAATPEQLRRRPGAVTRWRNLFLAGDWTATGLPATIEGAVLSGRRAARLALHFR